MKPKYYFRETDSEMCYTLDYHIAEAKEYGLTEIELYKAVPEKIPYFIWCNIYGMSVMGGCGKECISYNPRNGKSGMCKNQGRFYTPGEKVKFKVLSE